jgi:hypothetical protein
MIIADHAVSSYLAISPLPIENRRFLFCGTVRHHVNGAQELPGGLPSGARTFLDGTGYHRDYPITHTHTHVRNITGHC